MKLHVLWIVFLALLGAAAVWFTVSAGIALNRYLALSLSAPAKLESLEVAPLKRDRYSLIAKYNFSLKGDEYSREEILKKKYPNAFAARQAQEKLEKSSWTVWIDPKHPERSSLEKTFPFKRTLSAIILIALVLYFFCLALYVGWKK